MAAPISYFIDSRFDKKYPKKIIDFRDKTFGESYKEDLIEYISLNKILSNLQKTNDKNQEIKMKISFSINDIIYKRSIEPQHLIHCLDDICLV